MNHSYSIKNDLLSLRPILNKDLENLRKWRNQEDIRKWFFSQITITELQQISWYENYLKKNNDIGFIIEETTNKKSIGTASIYNIDFINRNAEFGRIFIGESEARGKGYGLISCNLLVTFAFNVLKLDMVYLEVFSDNSAAIKSYLKAGFSFHSKYLKDDFIVNKMTIHNSAEPLNI